MGIIKKSSPKHPDNRRRSSSNNNHLVNGFFEPAAPTFHEPLTKKSGLYSNEQEQTIKRSKEGGDYREELLLSQRSRRRCRYAELLSQSRSCAMRRSSGASLLIRPRTRFVRDNPRRKRKQALRNTKLLTQTSTSELLIEEERDLQEDLSRCPPIPLGSGTLGHMEALDLSTRYRNEGMPHPAATSSSAAVEAFGRSFDDPLSLADVAQDVSMFTTLDLPSSDLVSYMRGLAEQRDQQQLVATAEINELLRDVNDDDDDSSSDDDQQQQQAPPPPRICLENSAAIAVSMLVEELLRDFMKNWGDRARQTRMDQAAPVAAVAPLSILSKRTVRAAARLQIQGCSSASLEETSADSSKGLDKKSNNAVRMQSLLRNRLEVLFGQDLSKYRSEIGLQVLKAIDEENRK